MSAERGGLTPAPSHRKLFTEQNSFTLSKISKLTDVKLAKCKFT